MASLSLSHKMLILKTVANVQSNVDAFTVTPKNSGTVADSAKKMYTAAQCEQIAKMIQSSLQAAGGTHFHTLCAGLSTSHVTGISASHFYHC